MGRHVGRREVVTGDHWFEPVADHLGAAYLRYSFTKGTVQEVDHLVQVLDLAPGSRILDVGCGPGRHAHELARRGYIVHGIDISRRFVELARTGAPEGCTFERLDARAMSFRAEFDAVVCLCQGAFGLMTADGDDERVLTGMAAAVRPGGRVALSAFNAYFAVRHFAGSEGSDGSQVAFDADAGISHERTEVRDEAGLPATVDLWTGCYTPRELRLLCRAVGLEVQSISGVEPGRYGADGPSIDLPEYLVVARAPDVTPEQR